MIANRVPEIKSRIMRADDRRMILSLLSVALFTFALNGCGKRKPPLPPVERVQQSTLLLSGIQRGDQVVLSFPAPQRNAPDRSVQSIRRIDVYRLAEDSSDSLSLTEENFSDRATLIGSIPYDIIEGAEGALTYTDALTFGGRPVRLRYAVRFVNASNQRAAFSNFLLIEPASRVAQPPVLSSVANETERSVVLRWRPPVANVDGSTPANVLGYNIYRSSVDAPNDLTQAPLNPAPITREEFADSSFEFGKEYSYLVRTVSLGTEGVSTESLNSNSLTIKPTDTFAPSAPSAISIAAAPGRMSLFFPANPEPDVSGYLIFRTTDPQQPKESWARLTRTPLTRTIYQDEDVQRGTRYYYYLIAVDAAGNASQPSEVFSEVAP